MNRILDKLEINLHSKDYFRPKFINWHNNPRQHQALVYQTPGELLENKVC
jgi:hypothetical protein